MKQTLINFMILSLLLMGIRFTRFQIDDVVSLFLKGETREKNRSDSGCVCANYNAELDEDGQVDFKGKAKAFVRMYNFLASILPYANSQWKGCRYSSIS